MKALRFHGPHDIRLEDIPIPQPQSGEARIRITYASICATDIERWQHGSGRSRPTDPKVIGHESSGHVETLGPGTSDLAVGDRVMVNNVLTCGECTWCESGMESGCEDMTNAGFGSDGGLAEYMVWPTRNLIKLPDNISDREAPLIEPTTVGVHAADRSGARKGEVAVVIGCGTVGLLTMQALTAKGARVIAADIRQESLDLAKKLGAIAAVDSSDDNADQRVLELTGGLGADVVVETAGARTTPGQAIRWTRRNGTTVLVGIYSDALEFNFNEIVMPERKVIGSVGASAGDMERAVDLISQGKILVHDLISEVIPLDRVIEEGFERMARPIKDVYRIMVSPNI